MRPLLILAETRHLPRIQEIIKKYGHPAVVESFVRIIDVDLSLELDKGQLHYDVLAALREKGPDGASQGYTVCATTELARALGLKSLLQLQDIKLQIYSGKALAKPLRANETVKPELANLLGACELSIHTAASKLLYGWSHSLIDVNALSAWKGQFGRLGKFSWVADTILANTVLIAPHELGRRFVESPLPQANVVVYNKDSRGTVKSGEVIANLLTKQLPGLEILDSLTDAIEKYPGGNIVMVEDGLWTGTEAVGVFESLLGNRPAREKTKALTEPALLEGVTLTLIYGITTDYGTSMVNRYLNDKGLSNIRIYGAETLSLSSEKLLQSIQEPSFDVGDLRNHGPDPEDITPHFSNHFDSHADKAAAVDFCKSIGQQLFDNYLADMRQAHGWGVWADEKRLKCCFGMNGLGLTHAFGHSIPKASLPLLWCKGTVEWAGHTVEWVPLFGNA